MFFLWGIVNLNYFSDITVFANSAIKDNLEVATGKEDSVHIQQLLTFPTMFSKSYTLCLMSLTTLFQLYQGDSSLIHDPWVNKPLPG